MNLSVVITDSRECSFFPPQSISGWAVRVPAVAFGCNDACSQEALPAAVLFPGTVCLSIPSVSSYRRRLHPAIPAAFDRDNSFSHQSGSTRLWGHLKLSLFPSFIGFYVWNLNELWIPKCFTVKYLFDKIQMAPKKKNFDHFFFSHVKYI